MNDVTLGKLIGPESQRDAIHIAIAPVIADETLEPGAHVGLVEGTTDHVSTFDEHVGVIDPFLTQIVKKGERCFLFLYQNTVTGMRHHWEHPKFSASAVTASDGKAAKDKIREQHHSERWIRDWSSSHGVEYEDMMQAAENYVERDDYFVRGGQFEGEHVPDEFWDHYQIVTGEVVKNKGSFFSCSC